MTNSPLTRAVQRAGQAIAWAFAEAPGAIEGHVNASELLRAVAAGIMAGGSVGSAYHSVLTHLPNIFPDASDAAIASAVCVIVSEVYRRLGHGQVATLVGRPVPAGPAAYFPPRLYQPPVQDGTCQHD